MNSVREVQQARLIEKFERELGEQARQGILDPAVTDLIVNQDGHLWFDAHGKGMWDTNYLIPPTQVESAENAAGGGARLEIRLPQAASTAAARATAAGAARPG